MTFGHPSYLGRVLGQGPQLYLDYLFKQYCSSIVLQVMTAIMSATVPGLYKFFSRTLVLDYITTEVSIIVLIFNLSLSLVIYPVKINTIICKSHLSSQTAPQLWCNYIVTIVNAYHKWAYFQWQQQTLAQFCHRGKHSSLFLLIPIMQTSFHRDDKNLCNKALVSEVKALGKAEFATALKSMAIKSAVFSQDAPCTQLKSRKGWFFLEWLNYFTGHTLQTKKY